MNNLERLERLEEILFSEGIEIDWYAVRCDGYINLEVSPPYIAVNPALPLKRKTAIAYHEVGHLRSGLGATAGKNENRARRWAEIQLIHPERMIEAVIKGAHNFFDLADALDLDEELLHDFLLRMAASFEYYEHGDYVISFKPIIVHNRITGQMWPDE